MGGGNVGLGYYLSAWVFRGSSGCALVSLILARSSGSQAGSKTHPDYSGLGGVGKTMKHEARH